MRQPGQRRAASQITSSSRRRGLLFGAGAAFLSRRGSGAFLGALGRRAFSRAFGRRAFSAPLAGGGAFFAFFLLLFDHLDFAGGSGGGFGGSAASSSSVRGAATAMTGICLSPRSSTPAGGLISPR